MRIVHTIFKQLFMNEIKAGPAWCCPPELMLGCHRHCSPALSSPRRHQRPRFPKIDVSASLPLGWRCKPRAYLSGYHRAARYVCGLLSSAIKKRNSLFGSGSKGPRPLTLATGAKRGPHMEGANSIGQPVNEHKVLRIVNVRSLSPPPPPPHHASSEIATWYTYVWLQAHALFSSGIH